MENLTTEDTSENHLSAFHNLEEEKGNHLFGILIFLSLAVFAGVAIGYLVSKTGSISQTKTVVTNGSKTDISKGMVFGVSDISPFPDSAEGVLEKGGINNEGQYHLVRSGGKSQYVYLTSSVVDLSMFKGRQVKVNGATQKAQSAGWLMDVGRVEVEN